MTQVIPEAAVEAARERAFDYDGWRPEVHYIRAVLEAAAPHILSAAFKNAADQLEYGNPISGWLYDLADDYMLNKEGEK